MVLALESLDRLRAELQKMPGIGTKSAERLAYHVLKSSEPEAMRLAAAIQDVKLKIKQCSRCFNITEVDPCAICTSPSRDTSKLCVVEQPRDLISIETTGEFRGMYHVLQGRIAPLDGIEPDDLTIRDLVRRVREEGIREVILATNPDMEGDGTALYIAERLRGLGVGVSRIAKGIPAGSNIEFVGKSILRDALSGRHAMHNVAPPEFASGLSGPGSESGSGTSAARHGGDDVGNLPQHDQANGGGRPMDDLRPVRNSLAEPSIGTEGIDTERGAGGDQQ